MRRAWFLLGVLASGMLVSACSRGARETKSPEPPPGPASAATSVAESTPARDVDKEVREYLALVFPPAPGRDELFHLCTNCHGILVFIFSGQSKDEGGWRLTRRNHAIYVGENDELGTAWNYASEQFGSHRPPPPPPPDELVTGWQNYL